MTEGSNGSAAVPRRPGRSTNDAPAACTPPGWFSNHGVAVATEHRNWARDPAGASRGCADRPAKQATRQEGTGVLELRESCVDELLTVLFKVQLSVRACPILGVESPTAQRLGCDLITLRKSAFVTSKAKSRRFLMPWGERVGRNKTYSRSRSRRSDA